MRENEVRTQVSGARSAQNDPGLMSSAVRQTPLTETLWPVPSSFGTFSAAMVMRRFSPRCSTRMIFPTSSTMPVNMNASGRKRNILIHHRGTETQRNEGSQDLSLPAGEAIRQSDVDSRDLAQGMTVLRAKFLRLSALDRLLGPLVK